LSTDDLLKRMAELPVRLVPIRLDLEVEGIILRDAFTWNLNESLMTPEYFAHQLCQDFDTPISAQFIPLIAESIRKQVQEYGHAVEEDCPGDGVLEFNIDDVKEELAPGDHAEESYGDMRIVVKLDMHVGPLHLKDQFEWPLFNTYDITPEVFSRRYCTELGIAGEFIPIVAHAIREQVVNARMNFGEAEIPPFFRQRPLRGQEDDDIWEPELRQLSQQEVDQLMKEEERQSRYMI
ncbi:hypothetical protein EDD86DRAFT_194649, partial [Gorgonomyces haynaldii]